MTADPGYERLLHFEDCASAIDQLFQKALREQGPSAFDEFLSFITRFNDLSVYSDAGAGAAARRDPQIGWV